MVESKKGAMNFQGRLKVAYVGLRGIPGIHGGVDRVIEEIGPGLAERDHKIIIFCWKNIYQNRVETYKKTELVYVPTIPVKYLGTLVHTLLSCLICIRKDIDIVHINNLENAIFGFIPRIFGKKVVIQPHGPAWPVLKWGRFSDRCFYNLKILISRIYLNACRLPAILFPDKLLVISGTDAEYISKKKTEKVILIHNGCNIPERKQPDRMKNLGIAPEEYLLFVGRMDPRKGCHHLIKAFKELKTKHKLLIVGGPLNNTYGRYITKLSAKDDRIVFLGPVYDSLLIELFSNALIYCHPSESEGQSISLLEGLAFGNCVVASDTPESVETAEKSVCYFKNGDCGDLKKVIEDLLDSPDKIEKYRKLSHKHVLENYQWPDKIVKYESLYRSLNE